MSAHLYINSKGFAVKRHSYSAGDVFNFCAQKYKLARVDGWQEKRQSAAFAFGIALENAVRTYHETGLDLAAAIKEFFAGEKGWDGIKDNKDLAYTATEAGWEALAASGREMLQLYALRLPYFPIVTNPVPKFQVQFNKEVFPGTKLAGIEFVAYVDMIAAADWSRLIGRLDGQKVPVDVPKKYLIDIKTSGVPLDSTPGILALDQQLRTYSWVTDIPDVAFLWFQKVGRGLERGSLVHLLNEVRDFDAGKPMWIAGVDKGDENAPGDLYFLVDQESKLEEMNAAQGYKDGKLEQTKVAKDRKVSWLQTYSLRVPSSEFTKQRIQFQTAHISKADREEAATSVGHDIAQIHHAAQENFFPKQGSIRGFNSKCPSCPMLGICTSNNTLRDSLVERKDQLSEFD